MRAGDCTVGALDSRDMDETAPDLRAATLSGVKWTSIARLLGELATFASSIALARLISPAEFGETVVAVFFAALGPAIAVQGVGSWLVHAKAPSARHERAAVLLCILSGLVFTALTVAFALVVAPPLFGDRAADLLLLISPVMLLSSLVAVPMADLQRRLDFRRLAWVDLTMTASVSLVAVLLAALGLEAEALIGGYVASAALTALLASAYARPPRPGWCRPELGEIAHYGTPAAGSSMLHTVTRNADYVILAARLPAAQVGYYLRGFQLGSEYQAKISGILLRVALPVLSRATDLDEVRRIRARIVRTHASVLFPLLLGLIALAPLFVPLVYGPNWEPAVELTQILAIAGLAAALGTGTGPLLLATGHPRALLVYNLLSAVVYIAAVLIALPMGLTAVCWAVAIVTWASFFVLQYAIVDRIVGIPLLDTLRDALPALVAGLPLLAVSWLLSGWLEPALPDWLVLVLAGMAGLAAYALCLRLLFASAWSDLTLLAGRAGLT